MSCNHIWEPYSPNPDYEPSIARCIKCGVRLEGQMVIDTNFEQLLEAVKETIKALEELPVRTDPEEELMINLIACLKAYYANKE